jgi:chitinase
MRRGVLPLLLVLAVAGGAWSRAVAGEPDADRGSSPTTSPLLPRTQLWVAPYHPCYQWSDVPAGQVPWGSITHLILGYMLLVQVSPTEYTIAPPDWYPTWFGEAGQYIAAGDLAGRTVTCMLGGEGSNPGNIWNNATSPANVAVFAANIKSVLQPLGFDGVDLDWEDGVDYPGLVRLAQQLRSVWPEAVITIPTSFAGDDAVDLSLAAGAVDAFMPMTYIAIPQWGGWTLPSPLTPLYVIGYNRNSVDWVRQAWVDAGVPATKLVMGVGGFGLVWGDTNGDGLAPIAPYTNGGDGTASGESGGIVSDNAVTQAWLTETLAENPGEFAEVWDDAQKISYWHSSSESVQVTVDDLYCVLWNNCATTAEVSLVFYETPQAIRAKVSYVEQNGMKGMMFWTLSQMRDGASYPILDAIGVLFADGFESGTTAAWSGVGGP